MLILRSVASFSRDEIVHLEVDDNVCSFFCVIEEFGPLDRFGSGSVEEFADQLGVLHDRHVVGGFCRPRL